MTKMTKATKFGLVLTALAGLTAGAQTGSVSSVTDVPGLNPQTGMTMNVAQVKDDLFAGTEKFAQTASKVTEINLDPSTMSMMGQQYGPAADMAKKMKLMAVHTYSYDKPGMYRMEDVEAYSKKLLDGSWNCPIVVREKDGMTYMCTKTDSDQTNEMVVLTAQPQQITFIHMAGAMSLSDLTHMNDRARSLTREVEPRDKQRYFFDQQDSLQQQQQMLDQLRRFQPQVPGKTLTVPVPVVPKVPTAPPPPTQ